MVQGLPADGTSDRQRLVHLNAVLRAIRNVNQLIVREEDPETLIRETCRHLVETRGYNSAWIALFKDDGSIGPIAHSGRGERFPSMAVSLRKGDLPACVRGAMGSPGTHVVHDSAEECSSCPFHSGRTGRSAITVRVTHEQKLYGLMGVTVPATFTIDEEETGLIDEVGEDIGFALHAIEQDEMGRRVVGALRRERDFTATLFDMSPVAIAVVDATGAIVQANAEAERVLGLRKDGITQRTYNDPAWHIVDYEGRPIPAEQLPVGRVLSEKRAVYGVEHAIVWPTGASVLLSINAAPVYSDDGQVAQVVCTMQDVTAQRRMEAALRKSEHSFRGLFESMLSGFALHEIILDSSGKAVDYRFLEVNPAFERLTGLKARDIIGRTVREVMPGIEPQWVETYGRVVATGDPVEFESYAQGLDRHFRIAAYSPEPGRFATVFEDISERKKAEEEIRRLAAFPSENPNPVMRTDENGVIVYANRSSDTVLRSWGIGVGDTLPAEWGGRLTAAREDGSDVRADVSCGERILQVTVAPLEKKGGFNLYGLDVTAVRVAEQTLRISEEKYRSLFEHAMDAIWLLRPDGTGNVVNKAWLDLFRYDAADIPSLTAKDLYADPAERADFLQRISRTGYVRDEVRFKRKDGTVFECERAVVALKDAAGRVVSFQGVIRDITEHKRAEKELAESRENLRHLAQRVEEAREEERTAIARELHDRVGQTLTAVKLDIDRLRRVVDESHPELSRLVEGMATLVDDGADDVRRISSDLRPGALDDLGLAGAIEWQLDQLRPRTDLVLTFSCDEGACELGASRRTALFRVFQELVTNVVRHAGAKKVDVSMRRENGALVLTVIDDGRGIDAWEIDDRHSLGIVGMRERLLPYGGELHIEGLPGKGTTARVTMPTE